MPIHRPENAHQFLAIPRSKRAFAASYVSNWASKNNTTDFYPLSSPFHVSDGIVAVDLNGGRANKSMTTLSNLCVLTGSIPPPHSVLIII